jgi:hypothetical protein
MHCSLFKAVAFTLLSFSASASFAAATTTFDFGHLTSNSNNSGKGTGGTTPDFQGSTLPKKCTGGDFCSSNVDGNSFGGSLVYLKDGFKVTATGFYNGGIASVVQDHISGVETAAGLGVYHLPGHNEDDNVTEFETLTMTFEGAVKLNSIGLSTDGHTTVWSGSDHGGKTFQYQVDGGAWTESTALAASVPIGNGTKFSFRYGGATPDQFYLGAMTVTAVPEPETYAMLLAGLGLMGAVARRRKAKQVA